jgi:hypothetical protein
VYDYRVVVVVVLLGLLIYAGLRRVTVSLLAAITIAPFLLIGLGWPAASALGVLVLAALILFAHRHTLRAKLAEQRPPLERHDAE